MKAIVNVPVCTLYTRPTRQCETADEVLYGMVVEILEQLEENWLRVRTHYRYEGYASAEDLITDPQTVEAWCSMPGKIIRHRNFGDVLSEPRVQGWRILGLPRGAEVKVCARPEEDWQKVILADGTTGFLQTQILADPARAVDWKTEEQLRRALVDAAMAYRGTHYRWGGKTPGGIDCSGLTSMAYMLCGILIYRDARLAEGFPIREISLEDAKMGDLLYFPGHIAMYLGEGRYCHSTGTSAGFAINSLHPEDPDYREDLHQNLTQVGSYF